MLPEEVAKAAEKFERKVKKREVKRENQRDIHDLQESQAKLALLLESLKKDEEELEAAKRMQQRHEELLAKETAEKAALEAKVAEAYRLKL